MTTGRQTAQPTSSSLLASGALVAGGVLVSALLVAAASTSIGPPWWRLDWGWPVDESELGYRRLAQLEPSAVLPAGRTTMTAAVGLLLVFAVAITAHLTLTACSAPLAERVAPRRRAVASALVVVALLVALSRLGHPVLAWIGLWGLAALAAAAAVAAAIVARPPRPLSGVATRRVALLGHLALAAALAALAAVPLLQTRRYADPTPIIFLAQVPGEDARFQGMVAALTESADVGRVEVRRSAADPSWAIVQVQPLAGGDSPDARALVRYLRRDGSRFGSLVTGSAAGDIDADDMRREIPWVLAWFALAGLTLVAVAYARDENRREAVALRRAARQHGQPR